MRYIISSILWCCMIDICPAFLEPDCCEKIITLGKEKFWETPLYTLGWPEVQWRTAFGGWFEDSDLKDIIHIKDRIAKRTGIPRNHLEKAHFIMYEEGWEYQYHYDFFTPNNRWFEGIMQRGWQRTHTAIIYLNDTFTGWETDFSLLGVTIHPKTWKLVIWNNTAFDWMLDQNTLHAGLPVKKGVKFLLSIWIREGVFS